MFSTFSSSSSFSLIALYIRILILGSHCSAENVANEHNAITKETSETRQRKIIIRLSLEKVCTVQKKAKKYIISLERTATA